MLGYQNPVPEEQGVDAQKELLHFRRKVVLEFFVAAGSTKQGEMKCRLNVQQAKSALWFSCPGVECTCGDFDSSQALATGVAKRSKVVSGGLRCQGTRKRGDRE